MHVELHSRFAGTTHGEMAKKLTRACVHCGFCLPTCPTYADSRDERDSPRGRIYLIKQLLETGSASRQTQLHLDRCLTCRSCETNCPSGMEYGALLDLGRGILEQDQCRSRLARCKRWLLRKLLSNRHILTLGLTLSRAFSALMPQHLRSKLPPRQNTGTVPSGKQKRTMLLLQGCVQSAATPNTNAAARRVLDTLGISLTPVPQATCCGAVNYHLGAHSAGLHNMRRNIDAWWPHIANGAEAIVSSASGCGAMLIDYGRLLADDPLYADKARRVSAMARDLSAVLMAEDLSKLTVTGRARKVATHCPCTLAHALQLPRAVPTLLAQAGFDISSTGTANLCCGSAGTYSLLQPAISQRLLNKTLRGLSGDQPDIIVTANIGCQLHLQTGTPIPVKHWIELFDVPS